MSEPETALESFAHVLSPKSKWTAKRTFAFLCDCRLPLRVSTLSAEGFPHITSLWFRFHAGRFLCCTQQQSVVCRQVRRNPRVGFEVAVNSPPYYGVSGEGEAREAEKAEIRARLGSLSGREGEVLEGLLAGKANKVIAHDLDISPRTVEIYRANLMTKMRANSLSELVRMALRADRA